MPTVLLEKGYRFFFFSNEWNEPIHIHIAKDRNYAKFWLEPIALAKNYGFSASELSEIKRCVAAYAQIFKEKWHEHFAQ